MAPGQGLCAVHLLGDRSRTCATHWARPTRRATGEHLPKRQAPWLNGPMTAPKDTLGVEFRVGDVVTVTAWGHPVRLVDTGRTATVTGFTASGRVKLDDPVSDPIARGRAVPGSCLAVARRDGATGHEGNRDR